MTRNFPETSHPERNEDAYEGLLTSIEEYQGMLSPIIVSCDDRSLREQIIQRYEAEIYPNIRGFRIELGKQPSLKAELEKLRQSEAYLQLGRQAVFTVTGADVLLRVNLRAEDTEQTQLDRFFGYLQWTREGLREFEYPIVLWVTSRILREMSRRAPDFWSWRKGVFRFVGEIPAVADSINPKQGQLTANLPTYVEGEYHSGELETTETETNKDLPPLAELLENVANLEASAPESASLATLYNRTARAYARRVQRGEAENLAQEQQCAIDYFRKAIDRQQALNLKADEANSLQRLGSFYDDISRFSEAIDSHQQALILYRQIDDRSGQAISLNNLGIAYRSLGQYPTAIDFHQQSLEIFRQIGDRSGQAISLNNLGIAYGSLGEYPRAIDFHQQSLEIFR
ncbi:MAG: tetratricopeptide repeat protein, partial [Geitlerinemataceae cyanobacterium]